jgi:hypothetical protein
MRLLNIMGCLAAGMSLPGCYFYIRRDPPAPAPGIRTQNFRTGVVQQYFGKPQPLRSLKLASGKTVTVTRISELHFAPGGDPPALKMNYFTKIPQSNLPALAQESNQIWEIFRGQVEKGGYNAGVITAEQSLKMDGRNYTFVWKKQADGSWKPVDRRKR